ncbi:MAG: CCA tRNA nucleotidyltransferase [Clostridiales bacterium]|nr:CCA tRNA nucleotidyltransferase [Clostridiales bacterium]
MTQLQSVAGQVQRVLEMLNAQGHEAYLVGGCVRDLLMGKEPKDWDVATSATPEEVGEVFGERKTVGTGLKHGTVTVLMEGMPVEVTTYRVDGEYEDNRRPASVTFAKSLREDVARRDFTINAIAMDAGGEIIDHFDGEDDIRARRIRCVGDPDERFNEDGLRILRALRFASKLGFSIEPGTSESIIANRELLKNISGERIRDELTGLLCGRNARKVLRKYVDVVGVVIPEVLPMVGFDQRTPYHCYDVWEHTLVVVEESPPTPIMRWSALLHDIGKPQYFTVDGNGQGHFYKHQIGSGEMAGPILRRLKFDNHSRAMITTLVGAHMNVPTPKKKSVKRLMNKHGEEMVRMMLEFRRADNLAQSESVRGRQQEIDECERLVDEIVENSECFSLRDLAVDGRDMMGLGFEGPEIGQVLERLLEAVIEGEIENERGALIEAAGVWE